MEVDTPEPISNPATGTSCACTVLTQPLIGDFHQREGVSIFQKCPNFNYLFQFFIQFHLYEMSEIRKCPGQRGGVNIYKKCLKLKNFPKVGGGGGQP